jgi:hypothetical protein
VSRPGAARVVLTGGLGVPLLVLAQQAIHRGDVARHSIDGRVRVLLFDPVEELAVGRDRLRAPTLYVDNKVLNPIVAGLQRRGFQSHIHAIGDRAAEVALDSFIYARRKNPKLRSHPTIAHAQVVARDAYKKFGRADVTASMGLQLGSDCCLGAGRQPSSARLRDRVGGSQRRGGV